MPPAIISRVILRNNAAGTTINLGVQNFTAPQTTSGHWVFSNWHWTYVPGTTVYDTESWTFTFTGSLLTTLQNDMQTLGGFDIGIDPDCHYDVGSIVLDYKVTNRSVPDAASTLTLLGAGLPGLALINRKLCVS